MNLVLTKSRQFPSLPISQFPNLPVSQSLDFSVSGSTSLLISQSRNPLPKPSDGHGDIVYIVVANFDTS